MIRLSRRLFDPSEELSSFERSLELAGAIVSFVGKVRGRAGDDTVQEIYLEHFPGMTERSIASIEEAARQRWAIEASLIIHRIGNCYVGEPIVMVCVACIHRREAFEAADFLMDCLKTEALFWKRESRNTGVVWIEPREADYKDASRWEKRQEEC